MGEIKSLMKVLEDQSKGLGECFDQQNAFVRNCLVEFLQVLGENSPIPWSRMLDDFEQGIKALEENVCKCAKTKPWACGSGTCMDLLELVDKELKYTDEPAPPSLSSSYGTPPIAQLELIDERREGQEELHVPTPLCCAQPSPHLSTQVEKAL